MRGIDWTTEGLPSRTIIDEEVARVFGAPPSEEIWCRWFGERPDEAAALVRILDAYAGCDEMPPAADLTPRLVHMVRRIDARLDRWRAWRMQGHQRS